MNWRFLLTVILFTLVTLQVYAQDDVPVFTDKDLEDSSGSGYEINSGDKRLEDMTPEEIIYGSEFIGENESRDPCIPELDAIIEYAISSGIIKKIDDSNGHVFVGIEWYSMSYDGKEKLARSCGYYLWCHEYPYHSGKWVSIYDWYSGDEIYRNMYWDE